MPASSDEELLDYVTAKAAGCCADAYWGGALCPYHLGYLDGLRDQGDTDDR